MIGKQRKLVCDSADVKPHPITLVRLPHSLYPPICEYFYCQYEFLWTQMRGSVSSAYHWSDSDINQSCPGLRCSSHGFAGQALQDTRVCGGSESPKSLSLHLTPPAHKP